jgi:hypothetical protein
MEMLWQEAVLCSWRQKEELAKSTIADRITAVLAKMRT